jgi:uncharacterized membrane protein (UPF0127 family)
MLFTFENQAPALTMTRMRFPIDIVFVREGRVAKCLLALPGQKRVEGPAGSDMAIELPAGYTRRHGIKTGSPVRVSA